MRERRNPISRPLCIDDSIVDGHTQFKPTLKVVVGYDLHYKMPGVFSLVVSMTNIGVPFQETLRQHIRTQLQWEYNN